MEPGLNDRDDGERAAAGGGGGVAAMEPGLNDRDDAGAVTVVVLETLPQWSPA